MVHTYLQYSKHFSSTEKHSHFSHSKIILKLTVKVNHVVKIIDKHLASTNWPKDDKLIGLPAVARKARMMIQ